MVKIIELKLKKIIKVNFKSSKGNRGNKNQRGRNNLR